MFRLIMLAQVLFAMFAKNFVTMNFVPRKPPNRALRPHAPSVCIKMGLNLFSIRTRIIISHTVKSRVKHVSNSDLIFNLSGPPRVSQSGVELEPNRALRPHAPSVCFVCIKMGLNSFSICTWIIISHTVKSRAEACLN